MSKLKLIGTLNYYLYVTKEQLNKIEEKYEPVSDEEKESFGEEEKRKNFGEYEVLGKEDNGMYKVFIKKQGELIKDPGSIKEVDDALIKYKDNSLDKSEMLEKYSEELKNEYNLSLDSNVKVGKITDLSFCKIKEFYDINDFLTDVKVYNLGFIYDNDMLNKTKILDSLLLKLKDNDFIERIKNDKYLNRLFKNYRNKEDEIKDIYFLENNYEDEKERENIFENNMKGLLNVLLKDDSYNVKRHLFNNYINKEYCPITSINIEKYVNRIYGINKYKKRT